MRLDEYQWSHNPRGMHGVAPFRINMDRVLQIKLGWMKMAAISSEYLDDIPKLVAANVTPIVRVFRPRFGASPIDSSLTDLWRSYVQRGARWFEFYNEPNLDNEWPNGTAVNYRNTSGIIAPLMENWLTWAEFIINLGAYPAFPALAETTLDASNVGGWMYAMMSYLADNEYDRFRSVADSGLWCATHPYIYNHFYQARPGNAGAPRSSNEESAAEGGWHFEYPYDPISQASHPGLTAISGGPDAPRGDPIGLTGVGTAFTSYFQDMFGGGAVPVVGTEGGITPVPTGPGDSQQLDARYPGYDGNSHAEATVAMFDWIANEGPPWMFGVTLWKENDYFDNPRPDHTVERLAATQPALKSVQPIEALGGPGPNASNGGKGPGPIHASPDYHFIMFAPGFETNWFFANGRDYWEQFRPSILISADYIAFIPYKKSMGLTILSTPEMVGFMQQQIRDRFANVWFDLVAVKTEAELAAVLQDRVTRGNRFG